MTNIDNAVILAAGRGIRRLDTEESKPTPLVETQQGQAILDKQIESFRESGVDNIACLAGYHIEKLVDVHPEINYYYDSDWQDGSHLTKLAQYPGVLDGDVILTTGETLFENEAIERLRRTDSEIAVAVTNFSSQEVARNAKRTLSDAELVGVDDGRIKVNLDGDTLPDARLLGLCLFTSEGVARLQSAIDSAREGEPLSFHEVLTTVAQQEDGVTAIEVGDSAQKYDETHALARFLLGTKADTLERLSGLLEKGTILDQEVFDVKTWDESPQEIICQITSSFAGGPIAIRSSAVAEDGWFESNAGAFHTELNVSPTDESALRDTINQVVASLREGSGVVHRDQVLVQPQVEDVAMSGVAFTRELKSGGPYTIINYDDTSGRTDTVTAGQGVHQETVYFHHQVEGVGQFDSDKHIVAVKQAVDELRELLDDPPLDIEFAVRSDGTVVILQVRPLTIHTGEDRYDSRDVNDEIESTVQSIEELQRNRPLLLGDGTVLGVMPDWNPAEMIGTDPSPLAVSLYKYLITDDVWARARAESGYRDVRPTPLMITLAGCPYIDTLADFNSFLPATLPDELGRRLVNHYVDRLGENPELQDKVEFEVAFTCLDFAFDERVDQLESAGFDNEEIQTLREHLRTLTDSIVGGEIATIEEQRQRLTKLGNRRQKFLRAEPSSWSETARTVKQLLDDTREYGTLPFSVLARYAFIATSFLQSLVERGILTEAERETISAGMPTIAQELATSMQQLRDGELDPETFFKRYGHLRPGTYDICSPRYDEEPSEYFDVDANFDPLELDASRPPEVEHWTPTVSEEAREVFDESREEVQRLIDQGGFSFTADELFSFITRAIPLRELAKFEFTRNLSAGLTLLRRGAESDLGLETSEVASLTLNDLLKPTTENPSPVIRREFKRTVNHNDKRDQIQGWVQLPPLLRGAEDVRSFTLPSERPNFVTSESTTAPITRIESRDDIEREELDGHIVLIPSADPGYDWIFGSDIEGLVTKYGGVASHMAIRAAEFGIPAAIGCGEVLYEEIAQADIVELDSTNGRLREVQ
ncbi:hypothetical protein C453_19095 [Haloferax elongans ATCC BAA-1513]|uniref:Uncharacterized protein n=1 Tax=Haloferax elongans ATCC BAA-1513 TaxID=1230453 RepID=M0HDB6_HALEO|nr:PEP-utilizing enzyme [Haloferax elongans]ELZ81074.1 hypothetical protein C453_19095 [Haloferax elongans ATCC BAA-1513]